MARGAARRIVARFFRRNLRTGCRTRRLPLLRVVRSSEPAARSRAYGRRSTRRPPCYSAIQALPRREDVVRDLLAATAARVLASRARRQILHQTAADNSVHLAARSHTVAAARGYSAARNQRLARSRQA